MGKILFFSEQKIFNFDGPDGCQYYWYNLRKEQSYFKKRPLEGGSLMTCAAFNANKKTRIFFIDVKFIPYNKSRSSGLTF